MPKARVKFKPPGTRPFDLFGFTADHPDDEFRILSNYPTGEGLYVILEATMANPEAVVDLFERSPMSYEVLHADEHTALIQYLLPFVPPPLRAVFSSGNLPQFPLLVQDGWILTDLTTTQGRLSDFRDELEATGFAFEVVSVTQSTDPTDLLTDRQRRFMAEALERGYYDTPRDCSLTDLAAALDVSKSTASVVLHRAEETVVKEFFAESAD